MRTTASTRSEEVRIFNVGSLRDAAEFEIVEVGGRGRVCAGEEVA